MNTLNTKFEQLANEINDRAALIMGITNEQTRIAADLMNKLPDQRTEIAMTVFKVPQSVAAALDELHLSRDVRADELAGELEVAFKRANV